MNVRLVPLLLCALLPGALWSAPVQSPEQTIVQFAAHKREYLAWTESRDAAAADAKEKDKHAQWRLQAVSRLYSEKDIAAVRKEEQRVRERHEEASGILACARIADPEHRKAKSAELEVTMVAARAASEKASAGLREELEACKVSLKPLTEELLALMAKVGRTSPEFGIVKAVPNVSAPGGSVGVIWEKEGGNPDAYLVIRLAPTKYATEKFENVWGKFPLQQATDISVTFLVGHMEASFALKHGQPRGRDMARRMGEAIIDAEVLDRFRVARETDGELKRKLAEGTARYEEIAKRLHEATAESGRTYNQARKEATEVARPYNAQQVAQLERQLRSQEEHAKSVAMKVAAIANDTPAKRAEAKAAAEKALEEARTAVKQAGIPFLQKENELNDSTRRLYFHAWEMMKEVVRTPHELGLVWGKIHVTPDNASVGAGWRDALGDTLISVGLYLEPGSEGGKGTTLVAGKYPISGCNQGSLTLYLGDWRMVWKTTKDEWKDPAKMPEIVGKLLDFDAIAAWPRLPKDE